MRLFLFNLLFFLFSNFSSEAKKLDSLFQKLDTTTDPVKRASILGNIGVLYYVEGNYDKAIDYTVRAAKIGEQLGDKNVLKVPYQNLGAYLVAVSEHKEGIAYFQKCLAIVELEKDSIIIGNLYNNIGSTFTILNESDSALFYLNKALKIYTLIADTISISTALMNIAVVYQNQIKHIKTIGYYKQSLALLTPMLRRQLAVQRQIQIEGLYYRTCINIAECYINIKDYANGMFYLQKVMNSRSEYLQLNHKMEIERILADMYKSKGDFQQSLLHHERYVELKDSMFNKDKIESINEVTIKYEANKKERENKILQIKDSLSHKNILIKSAKIKAQRIFIWGGLIVSVLLFSLLLFLYRKNRLVKELNAELNSKNELLSIAKQKVELKALLNQINPHFIFNALNSIQQFILRNDTKSALDYFGKFGNLLRSSLEHSELNFVTIKEELDLIKNYVHLENLRFENPVQLIVDTGEIDIYSVKMPPMFIQPFIENAFAHGFNGKNENKHIKLSFVLTNDVLECTVTDNGNGRDVARMAENKDRYSGILITENRLKSIWAQVSKYGKIHITDLKDENNQPMGTMISLKLPYTF